MSVEKQIPQNLVLVPDSEASSAQARRRRPRLCMTSEQFRLRPVGKIFSIADLSLEGMALRVLDRNDLALMPVAAEIEGTLNLKGHKLSIQAQVKHLAPTIVGCKFLALNPAAKKALAEFLDPEKMGSELRPIPSSDMASIWYHGPSGTDFLLTRAVDGQYRGFTLFILGSFIQWDNESGLSTGRANGIHDRSWGRGESWGLIQFETMMLSPDPEPDADKLRIAKTLLMSSNLPQDLKKWCVRKILPSAEQKN